MIKVNNVTMKYGEKTVLNNFSMDFEDGESYVILGQSGCGKTTLLRVIAGLVKPTTGDVLINGKRYYKPTKEIVMLHQNYTNFPWKNSLDNVLTPLKINGTINKKDIEYAKQLLSSLGLSDFNKFPYEMSGGMNQRLALARVIMSRPKVLLMDEPTSALDEETIKIIENTLLTMQKNNGTLMITVTHNKDVANKLSNKLIKL